MTDPPTDRSSGEVPHDRYIKIDALTGADRVGFARGAHHGVHVVIIQLGLVRSISDDIARVGRRTYYLTSEFAADPLFAPLALHITHELLESETAAVQRVVELLAAVRAEDIDWDGRPDTVPDDELRTHEAYGWPPELRPYS